MSEEHPPLKRGDIVIVAFPFTDLRSSKRRPAVVIGTGYDPSDVILAFISSVLPSQPTIYDVVIMPSAPDFAQTGLKVASVIRLNKLATIDRALVTRLIGRLEPGRRVELDDALAAAVGIDVERYAHLERSRLYRILKEKGPEALFLAILGKT